MKQQRRYKEPQDTLWGKFLSGFMAVVFAMSTLTLIPIASAINGEPNEAQIQQQEELADQTSGKDEKAVEPAADEQKLEPVELLSIASVEDEDDADDAAPADVTLKVKAQDATVTYNGNDVATELVVPAGKDVKFTVRAADGFTLGAAAVKLADAKGETTLVANAGEYTVAADRVADGATVVVTAEAVAGSANTDAAEPSTPAPSTELGEKMETAKSVVTSIIDSVFGGTSTLAITGEDKVAVGKTISLTSNKGSWGHFWKSSDPQTATVSGDSKKATVTGVSAGTATITHTYNNGSTDKYTVTVFEATYPVYVYAQIHFSDGVSESERIAFNTDNGYKANGNTKDTWYTLGNIQSVSNIPDPQGLALKTTYSNSGALGSLSSINPWNGNKELIKHIANWDDLKVSDGADDYVSDTGTHTWHLDGYASVIKYTWVDRNETVDTKVDFSGSYTKENDGPKDSLKENPGYTFGGWTESKSGDDVVFTANWIPNTDITYVVNYVDAEGNVLHEAKTVTGQTMDSTVEEAAEAIAGYTADAQTKTLRLAAENNVITFVYTKGLFPYTVNYVDEDGNTLLDSKTGAPQEFESVISFSDEVVSIPGYVFESADKEQLNIGAVEADNVITLTYAVDVITDPNNDGNGENPGDGIPDKYQAVVNYESANDAQGTVNLAQKVVTFANNATSGTINIFDGVTPNPTAGFVFDSWTEGGNAVASNLTRVLQGNTVYTFTANWALDVIGTDPTDPGNNVPDGIADKYQLVVTYAAIAGTIDGPTRYVLNKYDAAGNLAEDGVAVLTAAQIPGATADDGYGNGVWNNEPLANMELTDDTAFVIAFTALPAAAPDATPAAAAPLAPVAAAAAAATILDDGVPLATIDDDENALAAFEEINCWTHWLMIFGALVTIVYGLAVLYRRRRGIRDMDDFEGDIMGGRKYDAAAEKNPAAGNAFQAM